MSEEKSGGGRSKGDIWWWNEEVKEAVSRKKDAHKMTCLIRTEDYKRRYKGMKKKAASKARSEKAVDALTESRYCPNWMFRLIKGLKTDSKEVEGGRYLNETDGMMCFC